MDKQQVVNKQILFKKFVTGMPNATSMALHTSQTTLQLNEGSSSNSNDVLVKNLFLSVEPYMRNRMIENRDSYIPSFIPGEVMSGYSVAKVILSNHPDFEEGDFVVGFLGWEEYSHVPQGKSLVKIKTEDLPFSYYLGVLGMPGLTAYAGFYHVSNPKEGERVFVSAACGAVGQLVGQFAKLKGCYVVGSAGSKEKVELLKNKFGYDAAFNYKEEKDLESALKRHFPKGIDIYFENVGGKMLEAVLKNMRVHGRIAVCGMISQYNLVEQEGIRSLSLLIKNRIKMEGFLVLDFVHLLPDFIEEMISHLREERLVYLEDITDGIENAPNALIEMLEGKNIGKKIVRLL